MKKLENKRNDLTLLDVAYAVCILLLVISFILLSKNIKDFHYAFIYVGMYFVYLFIRKLQFDSLHSRIFKKELLVYLIIFIAIINCLIGLYQFIYYRKVVGTFDYSSFFGCFLAINTPIVFGLLLSIWKGRKSSNQYLIIGYQLLKLFSLMVVVLMISMLILTKSRSALIGVGVVCPLMLSKWKNEKKHEDKLSQNSSLKKRFLKFAMIIIFAVLAVFCTKILYNLKPMSAVGRTLIWQVSVDMFLKSPVLGVGFSNFSNSYNLYQAIFFAHSSGNPIQKMTAGQVRHAYNWYLETATEFGILGLVVFGIFWCLVLIEVYKIFRPLKTQNNTENTIPNYRLPKTDYITLGMAGSVLCFMILSLFQFPQKIMPIFLIFNIALAWVVTANKNCNTKVCENNINQKRKNASYFPYLFRTKTRQAWLQKTSWVIAFVVALFFITIYYQRYMAEGQWYKAHYLVQRGKYQEAEAVYSNIYPVLKWDGRFLNNFGNVKLKIKKKSDAIELFEKAKVSYPDPYLFENLGSAYINYQSRITNEIKNPPNPLYKRGNYLSQGECVNKAIHYWILSGNILPWRLTPKYYLADLFYQIGDTNNAIKYARLVVNTPMKKWTKRGGKLKLKSQEMLIALGEKCDDPGLIVFDINDKNTWNEGKW